MKISTLHRTFPGQGEVLRRILISEAKVSTFSFRNRIREFHTKRTKFWRNGKVAILSPSENLSILVVALQILN